MQTWVKICTDLDPNRTAWPEMIRKATAEILMQNASTHLNFAFNREALCSFGAARNSIQLFCRTIE